MIKITALNEDSSEEENEVEGDVTREALEEIALQQYSRTLELQKKGNLKDALQLLKDLLDTELLYDVKKPEVSDNITRPLVGLKYLCYRNVATISAQLGETEAAAEAYLEASELDPTDITLWLRLGTISLKLERFDLALYAFDRGVNCNAKHWPCLDNLITLLLGLGHYNECVYTIYNALELDPDYLRGKVYRKHIFTDFPHIQSYLALINPLYKWTPQADEDVTEEDSERLLSDAKKINEVFTKQTMDNTVVERLPVLTLNKPVENLTWLSVGESIVDMHMYISENLLSHACIVQVSQPEEKLSQGTPSDEPMEVDAVVETKPTDVVESVHIESKPIVEKVHDEKPEKSGNESDKMDVEQDVPQYVDVNKYSNEAKEIKKTVTRRRGSSVSFLKQWEWCNKRKSSRKKVNRPDQNETIYDTLRRLLPEHLVGEESKKDIKSKELKVDDSLDTMDLYKLFEEKEKSASDAAAEDEKQAVAFYFNTEQEQTDVQEFIQKYVDSTCDIITMVDDLVLTLSKFWDAPWPEGLSDIYMEANWCSRQHSDPPLGYIQDENTLKTYISINLLHLEVGINKLLEEEEEKNGNVETELIDLLRMLCSKRNALGDEALTITVRFLWVKCHSFLYKDNVECALDCLYYILYELNNLEDEGSNFSLKIPNFSKWPLITKANCIELIKSLERNKQLATVPGLFDSEKFEEVLVILQDSFKHCQLQASKQDWNNMSLDWAVQLVTLMESLWALNNTEECFTWAAVCLHEALKQYMLCEQASSEYEKWSLVVKKALLCLEHILKQEGSSYLDTLSDKNTVRLVQDIIQIIAHQLDETNTSQDMPINTVVCWVLLHFVFEREEDCGRMKKKAHADDSGDGEIPASLLILFLAHDNLGKKGWCCHSEGHLLYFTLKTVMTRLRSPALTSVVEYVGQYLEQCVFCLFGHPSKKTKLRYLIDHNVSPFKLDWEWAQQIFDLYKPEEMPEFNSYRLNAITSETEQLFQRMLSLAPSGYDPQPFYAEVQGFIEGKKSKLPDANIELPYKMRDIYYLLADFYLKNNETIKALKYYIFDIVINKDRFDSWAGMALAKESLLDSKLNSCESFRTETEYLNRATAVECCFKQALTIDSAYSILWIEYGNFVYGVHSFCSRMLKQASESLSMESFEVLENRKETMLDTAHRCFINAHRQWIAECQNDDKGSQDERWLHYYMLGKIAEKKNENPQKYLELYLKAAKYLQENNAMYPAKINYNNPQNLSVEALEIHYRIHASILKYIEQHENKVIYSSAGKSFKDCLHQCAAGPFSKKKLSKDTSTDKENADSKSAVESSTSDVKPDPDASAKRSVSEVVAEAEEPEAKKAKVSQADDEFSKETDDATSTASQAEATVKVDNHETSGITTQVETVPESSGFEKGVDIKLESTNTENHEKEQSIEMPVSLKAEEVTELVEKEITGTVQSEEENNKNVEVVSTDSVPSKPTKDSENTSNTATSKGNSSSESSSDSSSEDSSTSSSSSSSEDSNDKQTSKEMSQEQISEVIAICLENLEDCVSRFPQHYKALYRLAHFYFYYKRERNVAKCKDLMLGSFLDKNASKLQGLFCERKNSNFFNGIWRIPASEVDRPGSFASHMSRCVLITMEVLKEVADYKTLLDLSLHLQRTPDAEKKYLRDAERIELYQQALSLCIRAIKSQLNKFSKIPNISSNASERKKLSTFLLDVYRAYQRIQKHLSPKTQTFAGLLIECYKIYSGKPDSDNILDKSIRKCQAIIASIKQQAQQASNTSTTPAVEALGPLAPASALPTPPPPPPPVAPVKKMKPIVPIIPATSFLPHVDPPISYPNMANSYMNFLPMVDRSYLSALSSYDQAATALYMSNMGSLGAMTGGSNPADFLRQIMSSSFDTNFMQPVKPKYNQSALPSKPKQTTAVPKPIVTKTTSYQPVTVPASTKQSLPNPAANPAAKTIASFSAQQQTFSKKPHNEAVKSTFPSATSPSPVPASPSPSYYSASAVQPAHSTPISPGPSVTGSALPAHQSSASTVNAALHTKPPAPHQQVSPGKTLQEKLAERQKQNPSVSTPPAHVSSASAAFSGKIPPSLIITKTQPGSKTSGSEEQKQSGLRGSPSSRDVRKSIPFTTEKPAQPTKVMDTSEVIVLDDD